jgi:beta-mannosidase
MKNHDLNSGWTVEPGVVSVAPEPVVSAGAIPATVPGSVHTDLLAAGLIEDPYLDNNESLQTWIGASDWTYRRRIESPQDGSERCELVFDGLDTVAAIAIGGRHVARHATCIARIAST